jgi:hypothetical protein
MISEMCHLYTAISIKVVHEQSGNVEYERERLLGIALKIHLKFVSDSQQPFTFFPVFRARIRLFRFARGQSQLK